jgi:large subunit ribosomal protein L9
MNAKVILVQDVRNLGEEGDVRDVARGYARNFLLPKKMVVPYTKANLAMLESRRAVIEKRKEEKRIHASGIKEQIEAAVITIIMPMGDNGRLFGSVTNAMISDELQKIGIIVERKKIEIPDHTIKVQGTYKVKIRLYDNHEAVLNVAVNPKTGAEKTADMPAEKARKAASEKTAETGSAEEGK